MNHILSFLLTEGSSSLSPIDRQIIIYYGGGNARGERNTPALSTNLNDSNIKMLNNGIRGTAAGVTGLVNLAESVNTFNSVKYGETGCAGTGTYLSNNDSPTIFTCPAEDLDATVSELSGGGLSLLKTQISKVVSYASDVPVNFIVFNQGEGDEMVDTEDYEDQLNDLYDEINIFIKSTTGQTNDIVMGLMQSPTTIFNDSVANTAGISFDLSVSQPNKFVLLSPGYPYHGTYNVDGVDPFFMNNHMQRLRGELTGAIIHRKLTGNWNPYSITSAVRSGGSVYVTIQVPVAPLKLDYRYVSRILQSSNKEGFSYIDSNGSVNISSVNIIQDGSENDGEAIVRVTLSSLPSGSGEFVRYAWGGTSFNGAHSGDKRGNLRDSMEIESSFGYPAALLSNWCPHFEKAVTQ